MHRHEAHDEIADRLRIFCADHSSFVHTIHAERLRILCSLVMNFADSLRLCALLMKTSQAFCTPLCTFCAPHSRKARSVSGRDEIADKFRLCAHSTHNKCGTPSPALCISCALHGTCQALCSPMMKFADMRRLCALCVQSTHDTCGTSQALCRPVMKLPTRSSSVHTPLTTIAEHRLRLCTSCALHGTCQALCTPMMKFADMLRLCALSVQSTHDNWRASQALCTPR